VAPFFSGPPCDDPGVAETIAMITCPLSSAPDGSCVTNMSLRLDGANTCGLEVVNGVMAARSPRSSGSRGAVQLGWWYSTGLQVLLQSVLVALVPTSW